MTELEIPAPFLRMLIDQLRARGARAGRTGARGGEAEAMALFETGPGDLREAELRAEIDALDADHRHELVALLWTGRGDFAEGEWPEAVALAAERDVGPTADYVLGQPEAADLIAAGLEELGHDHLVADGAY
ncbi:DUF3775 domain-containing protein [Jannaschia sp. Os4]|uniref:DUF3775 domain-containing protein n=1 Tax=Jannaschia sp. Os4 TaxID=2807617 RepID=UPI00193AD860|nr:DUF3775 domain-containing protein [Jannaschia sp. Os4]MBM2576339.1 DUF3775 domain-containing protein [Jannaschia sp. Os4]